MSDRIFLEGITFHGFHGLTRMERQVGVRLAVDLSVDLDLERSGRSDRVGDTVDYRALHAKVIELGRGRSHRLLESFARLLIDEILEGFPPVTRVAVTVRKQTPVLDGIVDAVGVALERTRGEGAR